MILFGIRKGCKEPLKEIEDFCGLRVICFFPSDLDKVTKIIEREFVVKDPPDKTKLADPEKFGYRSFHYIVTLKKDWTAAPTYRGLGDLKSEIQVRTVLSHAWADISHKLAYKRKEAVPNQLKRKFSQLSALLEIADERFEELRTGKEEYLAMLTKEAKKRGKFDVNQPLDLDSLQAFLDYYFQDRERDTKEASKFLEEIMTCGIRMEDLVEGYEKSKGILRAVEREISILYSEGEDDGKATQVGIAATMLDLTNDDYYASHGRCFASMELDGILDKWRERLAERASKQKVRRGRP